MKVQSSKFKVLSRKPLVSVIMPVHNAGGFLVEAIESILKQTYKNFDLIIVDDASTDNSWETISDYKKRYPKILKAYRISKQTNSAGNGATNYGLRFARGQFIARMDADDVSHPERLEKQVAYLIKHPKTILLGSQADLIDERGFVIGKKTVPTTHAEIYNQYALVHPMIHPSCMFNRSLLPKRKRLYEDKFGVNDDYYTFFKLLNYGLFANVDESLITYRLHGKNASLTNLKDKCINTVKIRLAAMKEFKYHMPVTAYVLMTVQFMLAILMPEQVLMKVYLGFRGLTISPTKPGFSLGYLFSKLRKQYTEIAG